VKPSQPIAKNVIASEVNQPHPASY